MAVSSSYSQKAGKKNLNQTINLSTVFVKDSLWVSIGPEVYEEGLYGIVKMKCTIMFNSANHMALFLMPSWLMCRINLQQEHQWQTAYIYVFVF